MRSSVLLEKVQSILSQLAGTAAPPKPVVRRSPDWGRVRTIFLRTHKVCTACGGAENLEVHHIIPVSVDPGQELNPANLMTLCERPTRNCHLTFGHCYSWSTYNPMVVGDANQWRDRQSSKLNCGEPTVKE